MPEAIPTAAKRIKSRFLEKKSVLKAEMVPLSILVPVAIYIGNSQREGFITGWSREADEIKVRIIVPNIKGQFKGRAITIDINPRETANEEVPSGELSMQVKEQGLNAHEDSYFTGTLSLTGDDVDRLEQYLNRRSRRPKSKIGMADIRTLVGLVSSAILLVTLGGILITKRQSPQEQETQICQELGRMSPADRKNQRWVEPAKLKSTIAACREKLGVYITVEGEAEQESK